MLSWKGWSILRKLPSAMLVHHMHFHWRSHSIYSTVFVLSLAENNHHSSVCKRQSNSICTSDKMSLGDVEHVWRVVLVFPFSCNAKVAESNLVPWECLAGFQWGGASKYLNSKLSIIHLLLFFRLAVLWSTSGLLWVRNEPHQQVVWLWYSIAAKHYMYCWRKGEGGRFD